MRSPLSCTFWPTEFFFSSSYFTGSVFTGFFFFPFLLYWVQSSLVFFSLSSSLGSVFFTGFFFFFSSLVWSSSLGFFFFFSFFFPFFFTGLGLPHWVGFFFFFFTRFEFLGTQKKKKKSCTVTGVRPPNSVKNSEWWKLSNGTKQPWYLEWWVMEIEWSKKANQTGPKFLDEGSEALKI